MHHFLNKILNNVSREIQILDVTIFDTNDIIITIKDITKRKINVSRERFEFSRL